MWLSFVHLLFRLVFLHERKENTNAHYEIWTTVGRQGGLEEVKKISQDVNGSRRRRRQEDAWVKETAARGRRVNETINGSE